MGLGGPKAALLMVELRVTRMREIQKQNQNRMPGTLSCGKSQAEAESQYIPGSTKLEQESWDRTKGGGDISNS